MKITKLTSLASVGAAALMLTAVPFASANAANCPAVTVAKDMGIQGQYPQQFELNEFEKLASCKLTFNYPINFNIIRLCKSSIC